MGTLRRSKQRTDAFSLARPAGSLSNFKESSKIACSQAKICSARAGLYKSWQCFRRMCAFSLFKIKGILYREFFSFNLSLRACLYGSRAGPLRETARLARSRCVVIFIVKIIVRLYGQAGWPGCRDLA